MIFEKIHTVPTSDELIDKAFRRATRAKAGKTVRDKDCRPELSTMSKLLYYHPNYRTDVTGDFSIYKKNYGNCRTFLIPNWVKCCCTST